MTKLISDKKKFKELTNDPTIKREQALQRTLPKLNKKGIFCESEYCDLYPKGSKIARLYGTPKMYKSFSSGSIPLLRPIVFSIDTSMDSSINSLQILVLYFHHIFPQTLQPKSVLLS